MVAPTYAKQPKLEGLSTVTHRRYGTVSSWKAAYRSSVTAAQQIPNLLDEVQFLGAVPQRRTKCQDSGKEAHELHNSHTTGTNSDNSSKNETTDNAQNSCAKATDAPTQEQT